MKIFLSLITLAALSCLTACGGTVGGSGAVDVNGTTLSHAQLCDLFLTSLNAEDPGTGEDHYTWWKRDTKQFNYFVFEKTNPGADADIFAVNIGGYQPGTSAIAYLDAHPEDIVSVTRDGQDLGGYVFKSADGTLFEETSASSKDMLKIAAFKQQLKLERVTDKLHAEYGLSESRSAEVARLTMKLASAPKHSMTDKDYDAFSTQILGSSVTEFQRAAQSAAQGESQDLNALIDKAARVNGIGPEQADQIMKSLFTEQ